jgi:arsenite-transporting ATPase
VTRILSLSLPGIDELAALLELARFAESSRFEEVVVDTAPTGHTLRMLDMPETLLGIARVFDNMREKHRVMVQALRGSAPSDAEDAVIEQLAQDARTLARMLRDPVSTRISWVTLPEPMVLAETSSALAALRNRRMVVSELIVNRVTPPPVTARGSRARCSHCDARRVFEERLIEQTTGLAPRIVSLLERDTEPRGVAALRRLGDELEASVPGQERRARSTLTFRAALDGEAATVDDLASDSTRLLLFGGKGGVGKTTCAAAAAVAAAARWPARRVLVISTDPAHSLGDAFGLRFSNAAVRVPVAKGDLTAREMDAGTVFGAVKQEYAAAIDALFDRFSGGRSLDAGHDRSVMHGLIDLAPPGLDELAATIEITEAIFGDAASWDLAIVDTAPTGHALRLLEMPALIHDWVRALMTILLKYQPVTGLGELGALLLQLSRGIGRFRTLLADPALTRFVVVTRAAALPRAESVRLVKRLERLKINVPCVIVNAVGRGTCDRCDQADSTAAGELAALRRQLSQASSGRALISAGTVIPPPHGVAGLERWQRSAWRVPPSARYTAAAAGRGRRR